MTWKWDQSAGELSRDGVFVGKGYAGKGRGWNNPAMQGVPNVGPIPRGKWKIVSVADSDNTGKFTIRLEPMAGTDTEGRSEFCIHGDNRKADNSASEGCIILQRVYREQIWRSGDRVIQVVA